MAYLFEMHSLSASYGANIVLKDVDFRVCENDFIVNIIIKNIKILFICTIQINFIEITNNSP